MKETVPVFRQALVQQCPEKHAMFVASPPNHGAGADCCSHHCSHISSNSIWNNAIYSKAWAWLTWSFSVLVCSAILSTISSSISAFQAAGQLFGNTNSSQTGSVDFTQETAPSRLFDTAMDTLITSSPVTMLKRQHACAAGDQTVGEYDMPLRIGAVFIILFVSASACAFPLMASRFPGLRIPPDFFFAVRHFGTGVLIATAFCHLLPTGFTLLHDPCLNDFWTEGYPAMPGAIALGAVIFVTAIEMWMHPGRHHHAPPSAAESAGPQSRRKGQFNGRARSIGRSLSFIDREKSAVDTITPGILTDDPENAAMRNKRASQSAIDEDLDASTDNDDDNDSTVVGPTAGVSDSTGSLTPEQKRKREITQCFLLEMGILFHSVFIGMALSVALGNDFVVLLIAISFHQTFEGLALGARIAAIDWPQEKLMQPWLMALAYGCTTPLGQMIGLATRTAYSPDSEAGLILVGVMNSISSGLLIFASLVELLSEDLLSDESWKILKGVRRVCAFLLVIAGAFGMSLIGAWA